MNQQIQINLTEADDICCSECGAVYFEQVFRVKRFSALMSPTGQELRIPIQLLKCSSCGLVDESVMGDQMIK